MRENLPKYKDAAWNNAFLDLPQACGQRCCSLPSVALLSYWSTPVGILCDAADENHVRDGLRLQFGLSVCYSQWSLFEPR